MIGKHCGKPMIHGYHDNSNYFTQKCVVCLKQFTQRKRKAKVA